ncbi:ABC transporter permease [Poseidonibacter antarcticus]|uniref:ABC transporter permease n=1 Tax=Poseidonibacter antarcticus TaxID=2478538 RepID=UPI000EF46020|nr:ABC transporter permease [Poseidonibacter antarcticus]
MINQTKFVSIFVFIILWQALSLAINSSVFPTVVDIVANLFDHLINGELIHHLLITLYRVFIAFIISIFLGVIFGILMGLYKRVDDMFDFLLIIGLNTPALVTIIICYIWFGLSDFSALLAVVINKVPIIVINVREGTKAINPKYTNLAKVYKLSKYDTVKNIYLPQIYPFIMASARLSLSLIWKIVLVVELLGRSDGMGFQISMFFQLFDITSILAYSLAFVLIILLIESVILKPIENKLGKWK